MARWDERDTDGLLVKTEERLAQVTIKIRGAKWKILLARPPMNNCDGLCDEEERTIYIRPTCPDPISTVIHEVLHAAFPDMSEDAVCEAEEALTGALELITGSE